MNLNQSLTASQVAKALNVSPSWVYRNKRALGGTQVTPGGRLLFFEDELQRRLKPDAISDEKREMACSQNDRRQAQNKNVQNQKGGNQVGGRTKRMDRDDPHGIFG